MYWSMRSRISWLKRGDRNTKYFHATMIQRRYRNRISILKLEDETWCKDAEVLKSHINSFYQALYESSGDRNYQPVIDQCLVLAREGMNEALLKKVTMEELKATMFQLGATKALGLDGLNGKFYQQH